MSKLKTYHLYEAIDMMVAEPYLQFFNTFSKMFYHSPKDNQIICTENGVKCDDFSICTNFNDTGWIKLNKIKLT